MIGKLNENKVIILVSLVLLLSVGLIPVYFNHAQAATTTFYLSPNGNDNNAGISTSTPFATLERARNAIRDLKSRGQFNGPVNVILLAGTYYLNKPFELTTQDSGNSTCQITYQAAPGAKVVISGGKSLTSGWATNTVNGKSVLVTNVGNLRFNSLFVNGKRAVRARTPNENADPPYYKVAGVDAADSKSAFYFAAGNLNAAWKNLNDIEIVASGLWQQSRFKISRIVGNKVYFSGKTRYPYGTSYDSKNRYYVENHLEGLDTPGEWYLDSANGNLYYYPLAGEGASSEFIVPVVDQLLKVGDPDKAKNFLTGDYVEIPDTEDLGFGQKSFSVSLWLYITAGSGKVLGKGTLDGKGYNIQYYMSGSDVKLEFAVSDGTKKFILAHTVAPGDCYRWTHFVWTVDRSSNMLTLYKDGINAANLGITGLGNIEDSTPLLVGSVGTMDFYIGAVDELRMFNKVLGVSEILSLYNSNSISKDNLVLYLAFEDNAFDDSGKLNHGIIYGYQTFMPGRWGKAIIFTGRQPSFDPSNYVKYVNFKNFTFAYTDWHLPKIGYRSSQAAGLLETLPAVMLVTYNNLTGGFQNNEICHTGGHALAAYSQFCLIGKNKIYDIGAGGIKIGDKPEEGYFNRIQLANSNTLINNNFMTDNTLYDIGKVHREAVGIFISVSSWNKISHNLIYNTSYSGISLGWWTYTFCDAFFSNNIVEYNKIYSVMQDLNDGGGIYLLGKQPGTQVSYNIVHDINFTKNHLYKQYLFGLYFDHAEGVTAWNNLVYRMAYSGIIFFDMHWNEAAPHFANKNNIVEKNIFADSGMMQTLFNSHNSDTFRNNVVYYTKNKGNRIFFLNERGIIGASDRNLYYGTTMPDSYPVYRFWNAQTGEHFYTADEIEKNKVLTQYSTIFQYEGVAFRVFKEQKPGTVRLYRFWNQLNGTHFYTVSEAEKQKLIDKYSNIYIFEPSVIMYVYPGDIERPNALPLYRFWNQQKDCHFYTTSETEKNNLLIKYPTTFIYEGIACYVCEEAVFDTSTQLQNWKTTTGLDGNSNIGNPNFRNPAADDYGFLSGPASSLGISEIYDAGPRNYP